MIAASMEKSSPFFLRRINIGTSYCVFQVSQASQASEIVELSLLLKPVGGVPAPTSRAEYNAMEDKMLDCFMFLKRNLVSDWKDVGRYLRVPEAELSRFSKESSIGESIFQMLLYWQRKNASEASTESLVKALKKLNRKDLIEEITEILN
ncbi:hypothetical protein HOLleu_36321 [Holothuria leucospilota]|uniref:Death domain-containing protein n=1 Tax=Holothuria leucospilota TaxID=206669 RepID=A0A9Q0YJN9_HOLLE|nr:hypothetical protein HOLleu_36321 [Holothuria leucospilota]